MLTHGSDTITLNEAPLDFDELGDVNFTDMNILFYYEFLSL